jgi:hypothetical protein
MLIWDDCFFIMSRYLLLEVFCVCLFSFSCIFFNMLLDIWLKRFEDEGGFLDSAATGFF